MTRTRTNGLDFGLGLNGFPGEGVVTEPAAQPGTEGAKKKSQKGNAIGGILGMLPSIAGAIPGLMKSKQTGALRDMQQGRGAGAMAARQAGSEAGRRTAGNVGGRGSSGQVRAGLRSAEEMTSRGAQAAGLIGAREGLMATGMLMDDESRRRNLGLKLGAGITAATGAGLASGLAGADQGPGAEEKGISPGGEVQSALAQMVAPQPTDLAEPMSGLAGTGRAPTLTPGAQGSPEGFGSPTYDQGLESVGGIDMSPYGMRGQPEAGTQLKEPMSSAEVPVEEKLKSAEQEYLSLNMRPSEMPLMDEGGSMQRTLALLLNRIAGQDDHGRG